MGWYGMVSTLWVPYHNGTVRDFTGIIPWYGISLVSYHGMVQVWDIPWDIRMGYPIAGRGIAVAGHRCWSQIARVRFDGQNDDQNHILMLSCSHAPCSHAPMLPCSHAPMLPCSHTPCLPCSYAPCFVEIWPPMLVRGLGSQPSPGSYPASHLFRTIQRVCSRGALGEINQSFTNILPIPDILTCLPCSHALYLPCSHALYSHAPCLPCSMLHTYLIRHWYHGISHDYTIPWYDTSKIPYHGISHINVCPVSFRKIQYLPPSLPYHTIPQTV